MINYMAIERSSSAAQICEGIKPYPTPAFTVSMYRFWDNNKLHCAWDNITVFYPNKKENIFPEVSVGELLLLVK